jgi:chromosome segregation ATPase
MEIMEMKDKKNRQSNDKSKLRQLFAQRDILKEKIARITKEKKVMDKNLAELIKKLDGIEGGIKTITRRVTVITTHFIQRWNERVCATDCENDIQRRLLTPQVKSIIKTLGNGTYDVDIEDFKLRIVVEDNKLLTVVNLT